MEQGLGVWLLEAHDTFGEHGFHSHHAIQLTVCLEGDLCLVGDQGPVVGNFIAVAADARHQLQAHGLIGIIFVEPESPRGAALSRILFGHHGLAVVDSPEFVRAIEPLRCGFELPLRNEAMLNLGSKAVDTLTNEKPVEATDPRILAIIRHAASHLETPIDLRSAAEATGVFLSESRLRHLFVEETGLAFKTYVLWLRLARAVRYYSEGCSLTEASHSAGFADSAHFSRTFKRTFGAPATSLARV